MSTKRKLYWFSQLSGWFSYVVLMAILNKLDGANFSFTVFLNLFTTFVLGVVSSHLYRELILKLNWLKLKIVQLIPRVFGASILFGGLFIFVHTLVSEILIAGDRFNLNWLEILQLTLNLAVIFMLWSLLYFLYHFIRNYRKEEIKNLQWQALQNEIELNKLKSQLNPHFIFNAMNSIRALVDENPKKAKDSITRLANILRSSLRMGREKVISLEQELSLVNDYLNLEKTRYEERLMVVCDIEEKAKNYTLPPMLLQTLVENGIKHGISKIPEGGTLNITAKTADECLFLTIKNSGQLEEDESEEVGFGLINTKQRLNLLYGSRARFSIKNEDKKNVIAEIVIPNNINQNGFESERSKETVL